jgi:hypothetical protein
MPRDNRFRISNTDMRLAAEADADVWARIGRRPPPAKAAIAELLTLRAAATVANDCIARTLFIGTLRRVLAELEEIRDPALVRE